MKEASGSQLLATLRTIVGRRHIVTNASKMHRFATGYRGTTGDVVAVVRPGSLLEQWAVLQACVRAGHIVIVQAANTGLTGGSTPYGTYDRPVVIINTMRIKGIHLLRVGLQVVCLAGATLHELERKLAPLNREPHSVIGSSCIGATVIGGICNNSGGALIRRGPAYTQYALYARIGVAGEVQLFNHLGIDLGKQPEEILTRIEQGRFSDGDITTDDRAASAAGYSDHVRDISAASAARYNADPERLFEASGSAGKVVVFAVRVDSFPKDAETATFYVGSNDPDELATLRQHILTKFDNLPVSGEYIHRDAFDLAANYGKDIFLTIQRLGTERLPQLFAAKSRMDAIARKLGLGDSQVADRALQQVSQFFPEHLPLRLRNFRDRFEHHLILKMADGGIASARSLFNAMFPSSSGDVFECTSDEERKAFLHRFAVAGAAIRYRAIHSGEVADIISLDVALRRNDGDWFEQLPNEIAASIEKAIYYGHFFCNVFHQDYILRKESDVAAVKDQLLKLLDIRGAQYPAEHNVGHLYSASRELAAHYRALDPGNHLNPGIGKTSRVRNWY